MTAQASFADFGVFYERTYPTAYRTACAIVGEAALAADAVQDACLSAFRQPSGCSSSVDPTLYR